MNKSNYFTGQPVFNQLLSLISSQEVKGISQKLGCDRYYKHFHTYNHLITMLYSVYNQCTSLREVVTGMKACEGKLNHLGINISPRRSTLSDANKKRSFEVFEAIYKHIHAKYSKFLSDSRADKAHKHLFIVDSTTISLFQEVMKSVGPIPKSGKKKGGIKVHTLIKANEDLPIKIKFTSAAAHDVPFLKELSLYKGAILVFDKAYLDYTQYDQWTQESIFFVTRLRKGAKYELIEESPIQESDRKQGVGSDHIVIIGHKSHRGVTRTKARLVSYQYEGKKFEFLTNNLELAPLTIANIYKRRWQIELLFKRIKQNYPLRYFLGDSPNAIKIQIWTAFIADLLLKIIQSFVKKPWAYSNLASMVRLHLMSYLNLIKFLNDPDHLVCSSNGHSQAQLQLFSP